MTTTFPSSPVGPETPQQAIHRIFTATLIIGVPGSGKTSLFEGAAEYCWETFRKVLCLYSWDGGAIPTRIQKRMKQGLIRFWRVRTRSADGLGIESTHLATKGYWPREINPETGETAPAVPLVAPILTSYRISCKAGHPLMEIPSLALAKVASCAACGRPIPVTEQVVQESLRRTPGFEDVGMVGFDGLTSMCAVVTEHMDIQRGQGQIGGEKSAFGGVVRSGGVVFGGSNRADVGFAQTRAQQWVNNSLSIPYLKEGPIFTALSMEVSDEGLPVVGPQLSGRAATDAAPAWFGNVVETGRTTDDKGIEHYTLFLRPFTDPKGRRHLLKTSASPTGVPDKLVDGEIPYQHVNLANVYRMLDADLAKHLAEDEIVGPGVAPHLYGDAASSSPVAAPAPAPAPTTVAGPVAPPLAGASGLAQAPGPKPIVGPPTPGGVRPPVVAAPKPAAPLAPVPPPVVAAPQPVTQAGPTTPGAPPPPPGRRPPAKLPT